MNANLLKLGKGLAAVAVLIALVIMVNGWWGEYKDARTQVAGIETTGTADATTTASPAGEEGSGDGVQKPSPADQAAGSPQADTVVVLIDGLNFRVSPEGDAKSIRGLEKGERLILLSAKDGWYEVRDDKGEEGWVSSNRNYTRMERR